MKDKTNYPDYLGVYTHVTCYCYCDKTRDDPNTRDYKEIGRIYFNPLRMQIYDKSEQYEAARQAMKKDFADLKNKTFVVVSATGQTAKIQYNG